MRKPTIFQIKKNVYSLADMKLCILRKKRYEYAKFNLMAQLHVSIIRLFINSQIKEEINEMRKKDLKFAKTAAQIIVGSSLTIAAFVLIETLLRRIFQ